MCFSKVPCCLFTALIPPDQMTGTLKNPSHCAGIPIYSIPTCLSSFQKKLWWGVCTYQLSYQVSTTGSVLSEKFFFLFLFLQTLILSSPILITCFTLNLILVTCRFQTCKLHMRKQLHNLAVAAPQQMLKSILSLSAVMMCMYIKYTHCIFCHKYLLALLMLSRYTASLASNPHLLSLFSLYC